MGFDALLEGFESIWVAMPPLIAQRWHPPLAAPCFLTAVSNRVWIILCAKGFEIRPICRLCSGPRCGVVPLYMFTTDGFLDPSLPSSAQIRRFGGTFIFLFYSCVLKT